MEQYFEAGRGEVKCTTFSELFYQARDEILRAYVVKCKAAMWNTTVAHSPV